MSTLSKFSFDYFAQRYPGPSTLAYWCVLGRKFGHLAALHPETIWPVIASQFSAEDQASVGDDDVWGDQTLKESFKLFAPVQLAERWSPLPYAGSTLGDPDVLRESTKRPPVAIAIWKTPTISVAQPPTEASDKWVHELLQFGANSGQPFALMCVPGFSWRQRSLSKIAMNALRKAGFAFDRRWSG